MAQRVGVCIEEAEALFTVARGQAKHGNTEAIWDAIDDEAARRAREQAPTAGGSWESAEIASLGVDFDSALGPGDMGWTAAGGSGGDQRDRRGQ
jgi:hypothetical protein